MKFEIIALGIIAFSSTVAIPVFYLLDSTKGEAFATGFLLTILIIIRDRINYFLRRHARI